MKSLPLSLCKPNVIYFTGMGMLMRQAAFYLYRAWRTRDTWDCVNVLIFTDQMYGHYVAQYQWASELMRQAKLREMAQARQNDALGLSNFDAAYDKAVKEYREKYK